MKEKKIALFNHRFRLYDGLQWKFIPKFYKYGWDEETKTFKIDKLVLTEIIDE